jgi:hypothetical protein
MGHVERTILQHGLHGEEHPLAWCT